MEPLCQSTSVNRDEGSSVLNFDPMSTIMPNINPYTLTLPSLTLPSLNLETSIVSSPGLCPKRAYVVTQLSASLSVRAVVRISTMFKFSKVCIVFLFF